MNLPRNVPPRPAQAGERHVIAESSHRARTVTCECGWQGSSEPGPEGRSPWQEHVAEHRPPARPRP